MNIFLRMFVTAVALGAISACQTPPPQAERPAVDPVSEAIDAVIKSRASSPARVVGPELAAPKPVFTPNVTLSYLGDARILLDEFAKARGLTFTVTGPMPHLPIYVQVHTRDVTAEAFLEEVARQLAQRGDIVLRSSQKVVELRYRGHS